MLWCETTTIIKFMLKSGIFLCLSGIFYVYYFSEVAEKYAHGYTNLVLSQDTTLDRVKFPFFTLCMSPHVKLSVLDKYNMSIQVLDEPNMLEKETSCQMQKYEMMNCHFLYYWRLEQSPYILIVQTTLIKLYQDQYALQFSP